MDIRVIKGDITQVPADAIVNAANSSLLGGGGVDGAIHRAGGPQILEECRAIVARQGGCNTGEAVITTAGRLPAKYVIHTVGPVWNGGTNGEAAKLAACYRNSLRLALDHHCRSVAFPGISTGVYRFPKAEAARIAVDTVREFLKQEMQVVFVCFDEEYYGMIRKELGQHSINDEIS
jgi:O-acetyl-ADP-ribose deacetylase (regulator of RNase III)